jgi:hypothetical protein
MRGSSARLGAAADPMNYSRAGGCSFVSESQRDAPARGVTQLPTHLEPFCEAHASSPCRCLETTAYDRESNSCPLFIGDHPNRARGPETLSSTRREAPTDAKRHASRTRAVIRRRWTSVSARPRSASSGSGGSVTRHRIPATGGLTRRDSVSTATRH